MFQNYFSFENKLIIELCEPYKIQKIEEWI